MTGSLSGKVAAVTGAGRGMGRAIALAFAEEGADVALIDRAPDHLDEVSYGVAARGRRSLVVEADITDTARLAGVFESIVESLGDLHILMNNAGISPEAPAEDTTEELWDRVMDVNAKGLFFSAQQAGRHFLSRPGGGKIINTSSTYGVTVEPGLSAYAASKGAVLQLTRALAAEWARHGVNVNAIGPTLIGTEMTRELFDDAEYMRSFMAKIPARALPAPRDIADAAVFLAGPRSDFVHGHLLAVDSGELAV